MTSVTVFAATIASQPLAFAHLLDAADQHGLALDLDLDLDHVEVIQGKPGKRLTHAFDAREAARVEAGQGGDNTLVLIFPEALIPGAKLFPETALLRPIGRFPAIRPRISA
jgi:hypothetical protein